MKRFATMFAFALTWIAIGAFGDRIVHAQPDPRPPFDISFNSDPGTLTLSFPAGTSGSFGLDINPNQATIAWPAGTSVPPFPLNPGPDAVVTFPNGGSVSFGGCTKTVRFNAAVVRVKAAPKLAR